MFKVKNIEIDSGDDNILLINKFDADKLHIYADENLIVYATDHPNRQVVCQVNILEKNLEDLEGDVELKIGEVGLYQNVFNELRLEEYEEITLEPMPKPRSINHIKAKIETNSKFTQEQFYEIMDDIVSKKYSKILTTFFVLTCKFKGLDLDETAYLTKAMVRVGKTLKLNNSIVADKHCIGGIPNNRTTPIIIPIIASLGVAIPNTFTRAITSPAGTADVLDTHMKVDLDLNQMAKMVNKFYGCLIWGGSLDLSPADDLIIKVEHPLSIDAQPQMIASILSKKISAGNTHLILDIPYGQYAKVKTKKEALDLKYQFEYVAKKIGLNMIVVITDGSQPIGNGIGPLLEMLDILKILKNEKDAPQDLKDRSLYLTGKLLEFIGKAPVNHGYSMAKEILESGIAYKKYMQIRSKQGQKELPQLADHCFEVKALKSGIITNIHSQKLVKVCNALGTPMDVRAGIYLNYHLNDKVKKGDVLYKMYSSNNTRLESAKNKMKEGFDFITIQ